jgi:S1-C subfamily serine protease
MNKILFIALALLPITFFFTVGTNEKTRFSIVDIAEKSMVQINDNCSGVVVDTEKGLVATANHCIYRNPNGIVKMEFFGKNEDGSYSKEARYGSVVCTSKYKDIAIVKVPGGLKGKIATPFAKETPAVGTVVYAIGNPVGWESFVTKGVISNNYYLWTKEMYDGIAYHTGLASYVSDVVIAGGSSGGPLVNEDGELLGLTNWRNDYANLTLITPFDGVEKEMKRCSA